MPSNLHANIYQFNLLPFLASLLMISKSAKIVLLDDAQLDANYCIAENQHKLLLLLSDSPLNNVSSNIYPSMSINFSLPLFIAA